MFCANQQVLRYTALGLGIFYGITHQRSITLAQRAAHDKAEYEHKQSLIQKAKEEFAKKNAPASTSATKTGGRECLFPILFFSKEEKNTDYGTAGSGRGMISYKNQRILT